MEDLEVIAGVERGHTRMLCRTERQRALAECCASKLVQHMAERIKLGQLVRRTPPRLVRVCPLDAHPTGQSLTARGVPSQCGVYDGAHDELLTRGDDTPAAAWGLGDKRWHIAVLKPSKEVVPTGGCPATELVPAERVCCGVRQTLGDVIAVLGRCASWRASRSWLAR
jgi:hypothetical protein